MSPISLSPDQLTLIERPLDAKTFLQGPAGCGKTTVGVERLLHLMAQGVRGDSILLLLPQRTLGRPYYAALRHPGVVAGGQVSLLTIGGLAQRMVELFWPLVAAPAGFAHPDAPPVFLTLETAQYYMARQVRPMLDQGFFEAITIAPNRLYSQVVDNLNKAAVVGFPYIEIGERLGRAWLGETSQARVYADAQEAAIRFREYCLAHNLLDFSLQVEVFVQHLWPLPACRDYLLATYRHLIVDNLEEDTPITHDLLREWLSKFDSALLIYDQDAGYRLFLGADLHSAYALQDQCQEQVIFDASFVTSPEIKTFAVHLGQALNRSAGLDLPSSASPASPETNASEEAGGQRVGEALEFAYHRYHPEMLDWVAAQIACLVDDEGVSPGEIVVLAPFLSDALRFSLAERLGQRGIPVRSHRPSRSLREEPAAQCLLTLASLAHPGWGLRPTRFDVAYALIQAIEGMDLVRAQLLAEIVYRLRQGQPTLTSFDRLNPEMQERITFSLGGCYEALRIWIENYIPRPVEELDYFWSRLFGELLSQPGYGFHRDYDKGKVAANLIESARKFRWVVAGNLPEDETPLGKEYVQMVQDGVVAAQYIRSWELEAEDAVLLAPAYTFLMANRPVEYQFWLDVGGQGWFERLYQPLTHPYVLSRQWEVGSVWTDSDEVQANLQSLHRLTLGLARRCRRKIYLGLSQLGEQGFEQQGPLLKAIQRLLRDLPAEAPLV